MVYELLPNVTRRINFTKMENGTMTSSFSLITTATVSTAILATSHQIKEEAHSILAKTAEQLSGAVLSFSRGPAPRIESDIRALEILGASKGLIMKLLSAEYHTGSDSGQFDAQSMEKYLAKEGYTCENGTQEDGLQELNHFAQYAAKSFLHQRAKIKVAKEPAGIQKVAISLVRPIIQIAIRKRPGDTPSDLTTTAFSMTTTVASLHAANNFVDSITFDALLHENDYADDAERILWSAALVNGVVNSQVRLFSVHNLQVFEFAVGVRVLFLGEQDGGLYEKMWCAGEWL